MRAKHLNEYIKIQEGTLTDKRWRKGLPKEKGVYWLYSYRYGKISCGVEQKPELSVLEVWHDSMHHSMHVCDGQFLYDSEIEEPYWRLLEIPTLPNERNVVNENTI